MGLYFTKPVEGIGGTPVANNDSIVMNQDSGPITINWIANDDMDDNATLDSFDAISVLGGSVVNNGNGTFSFTPELGDSGGDGFTYTICDDDTPTAECDTATVSITIIATQTCLAGFYQTISGVINLLDVTVSPAQYVPISPVIPSLNATGFNPNDGKIYGYSSTLQRIISFDPQTSATDLDLYTHTEDPPFAGDFDGVNNLYYSTAPSTTLWKYNTVTDTRTSQVLNIAHGSADIAYVPSTGLFYGVQTKATPVAFMAVVNVATSTVTTIALSGPITTQGGAFGAAWVTNSNTLYVFNNGTGNIYSIDLTTGASTFVTTSTSSGSNDGMSCATAADPFDVSSILDYGDAPDSYGTLLASSGASSVVNSSYRIGNYNETDANGQPSADALADDQDGLGDDEEGVFIGINSLTNQTIYESILSNITVKVPLNTGYVSMWIDHDADGVFEAGEKVANDVAPTAGAVTVPVTLSDTTNVAITTYARVRLSARSGGGPTGLYSFGEVEDYNLTINPSPPTITNDALSIVTVANAGAYNITGVCTDDGDTVDVSVYDGTDTVNATQTTCSTGTFSVVVNITSLDDGNIIVTSTVDDGVNTPVSDIDNINMDATAPTINQSSQPNITNANQASYPVSGTCTNNGDAIDITITDSDGPPNTATASTSCALGIYSVNINVSGLIDGLVNVESVIDDGINPTVSDDEDIDKDVVVPTIDQNPLVVIDISNIVSYPVSGTCAQVGDNITVTATDSDSPPNTDSATTTCQIGGTYSVILDFDTFISGNINVESTINDGVNPSVSDDEDITLPTNVDDDDTSSAEEKAGPNGGDGNDDGIPDYLQDSVTTKINPVIGAYVTIESTGNCGEFNSFSFYNESDLPSLDSQYTYDIGLHGFQITCTSPGDTTNIRYFWDQVYDTSDWIYRKFINGQYVDFSSAVTYGTAVVGGNTVTTVSFSIVDGGAFDSDGIANGVIIDPAGPAVIPAQSTPIPDLAMTGSALGILPSIAALVLAISATILRTNKAKDESRSQRHRNPKH